MLSNLHFRKTALVWLSSQQQIGWWGGDETKWRFVDEMIMALRVLRRNEQKMKSKDPFQEWKGLIWSLGGFPDGPAGKESACNAGDRRHWFNPWILNIPWRRQWQPTPVFLPGKSYGERSLMGYSPWGHKELDTTEQLTHTHKWM